MSKYIERFRSIEAQIHDMHFCDRVLNFICPFPHELQTLVLNLDLSYKDMDILYQIAWEWAVSASVSQSYFASNRPHCYHDKQKLLLRFGKVKKGKKPIKKCSRSSDNTVDELDTMTTATEAAKTFLNLTPEEQDEAINRIDMNTVICYNCRHKGHFANDCKQLITNNSKFKSRRNAGRTTSTIQRKRQGLFAT